jgi:hypothetical protein
MISGGRRKPDANQQRGKSWVTTAHTGVVVAPRPYLIFGADVCPTVPLLPPLLDGDDVGGAEPAVATRPGFTHPQVILLRQDQPSPEDVFVFGLRLGCVHGYLSCHLTTTKRREEKTRDTWSKMDQVPGLRWTRYLVCFGPGYLSTGYPRRIVTRGLRPRWRSTWTNPAASSFSSTLSLVLRLMPSRFAKITVRLFVFHAR